MTTTFGDFVFKISAPVKTAIDNLKMWDKKVGETIKKQRELEKAQGIELSILNKLWKGFTTIATAAILALTYAVMKYTPSIEAHLSLMSFRFRMLAIDVGKTWSPAFKVASDIFAKFVQVWKDWGSISKKETASANLPAEGLLGKMGLSEGTINKAKKAMHDFVNMGLGISAIIVPLAGFIAYFGGGGFLVLAIGSAFTVIGGLLAGITAPVTLAIATVTAIIIAGYIAWKENFMGMKDSVAKFCNGIKEIFWGLWLMLKGVWDMIAGLFTGDTERFLKGAKEFWEGFLSFLKGWWDTFTGGLEMLKISVIRLAKLLWDGIVWIMVNANDMIENAEKVIQEVIIKAWDWIKNKVVEIVTAMWDWAITKFNDIITWFGTWKTKIIEKFTGIWSDIKEGFVTMVTNATTWGSDLITNFWNGIKSMGAGFKKNITEWFKKNVEDNLSYDININDKRAQRWGRDMVSNFSKGVTQQNKTIVNQHITNGLIINTSSQNSNPYGISNAVNRAFDQQLMRMKALGTQF